MNLHPMLMHTVVVLIYIAVVVASPYSRITGSIRERPWTQQNQQFGSHANRKESLRYFTLIKSSAKGFSTPTKAFQKQLDLSSLRFAGHHRDAKEDSGTHDFSPRSGGPANGLYAHPEKLVTIKELSRIGELSTSLRNGLTFDPCISDNDCLKDRNCVFIPNNETAPCQSGESCFCFPESPTLCRISADCDRGEVCTINTEGDISLTFCASSTFVDVSAIFEEAGTGLNLFPCESSDDCKGLRPCTDEDDALCSADARCFCSPVTSAVCSASSECELGEVCTVGGNLENPICVSALTVNVIPDFRPIDPLSSPRPEASPPSSPEASPSATSEASSPESSPTSSPASPSASLSASPSALSAAPPTTPIPSSSSGSVATSPPPTTSTPSPESGGTGGGICIDATALEQFAPTQLVFQTHSLAHVLCDIYQSCATPGHMVSYHGAPMMMRSYCALVGCVKRVIHVNSPRYRRGLRVKSRTSGLEYTAFAARYETRAEEAVMQVALRVGM